MTREPFTLDNVLDTIAIFDGFKDIWKNYHVTKHLVHGYKKEGYNSFLGVKAIDIENIKSKQLNDLKCNVSTFGPPIAMTCKQCQLQTECSELIKPLTIRYRELILSCVKNDKVRPRHMHYDYKKKPNSTRLNNQLLFIDKFGSNLICNKGKKFFKVQTFYRINPFYKLKKIRRKFNKIQNDMSFVVKHNSSSWMNKVNNRGYENIVVHLPENW